ncbi:MAG TPA: hypothetical protein VNO50_18460 [Pyrinomonadaceae bacterium]|nr:hypothetical protein [Pyrinomonadaceae bacterium]
MSRKTLVIVLCVVFAGVIAVGSIADRTGVGCESRVERAFLRLHPDYEVVYVQGDGNDTPIVTYVISFRKPADKTYRFVYGGTLNIETERCEVTPDSPEF